MILVKTRILVGDNLVFNYQDLQNYPALQLHLYGYLFFLLANYQSSVSHLTSN